MHLYEAHNNAVIEIPLIKLIARFPELLEINLPPLYNHLNIPRSIRRNEALFLGIDHLLFFLFGFLLSLD